MRELTKILVTGASGFVGHAVQHELRRAFYPIHALMQPSSDPQVSCRVGSRIFRGDVVDRSSIRDAFSTGTEAVVHLVGIIEEKKDGDFERLHVEATRNVVELAKEFGLKKIVHMSALGTRPNAKSRYHKTKFAAEELVQKSGIPYTILRPSVVFGDSSEFLALLQMLARIPLFTPVIGNGQGKFHPVYVNDLARIVKESLEDEKTDGQIIEIGGPDVYTLDEMLRLVEGRLGKAGKSHRYFSIGLGELFASITHTEPFQSLGNWFSRNIMQLPVLTDDQLIMMQEDNVTDTSKMKELFAWDFTRLPAWIDSSEYVERPWRTWRSRWLTPPPGDQNPISGAGRGTVAKPAIK
jgi:uncharacterized protein YbjT (DUF2867 family)